MMRFSNATRFALVLASLLTLPACDREDPTTIGGPLVENGVVRTFEVTLDASQFLVRDTSFSAFPPPFGLPFFIIAQDFEDVLNANLLTHFRVDAFLGIADTAGTVKIDSVPELQRGRMVVRVDTVASAFGESGPVRLRLYELTESWDTATVSWTHRSNVGGVPVLWTDGPGPSRGVLLDTATLIGDTVSFRLDTLTLARWRDPAAVTHGTVIVAETPGTRLRVGTPLLRIDWETTLADTIVTQSTLPFASRFVYDPVVESAGSNPRVGGSPSSFRSVLEIRPDLADISVPCPLSPTCTVRLRDASIAGADLLLQPIQSPFGFTPELPVTVVAFTLLPTPQVPLIRSPLGVQAGGITVSSDDFRSAAPGPARLDITGFIRVLVTPRDTTQFRSRYLTLLQGGTATFGYANFAAQPRLRLRISVAQEIQLP